MQSLLIDDHTVHNLQSVTRVEFDANDTKIVADDQCAVFFIGSGSDPWVVRGEAARPLFERLRTAMNANP